MIENYISQNAPAVAENCIRNLLWHGKSFEKTLASSEKYLCEFGYCDPLCFSCKVCEILARASDSERSLKAFVNARRKLQVSPYRHTYLEYIRMEWETELPVCKIIALIKEELRLYFREGKTNYEHET